jgi:hypothetical protein
VTTANSIPAGVPSEEDVDEVSVARLKDFFELLDRWDRENTVADKASARNSYKTV